MNISNKNDRFTFGFSTASGNAVSVSDKALSKATKLFIKELNEAGSDDDICEIQTEINKPNDHPVNIGFQTASGKNINITDAALMKAKSLFSNETGDDTTDFVPLFDNKTANDSLVVFDGDVKTEKLGYDIKKESNEANISVVNEGFQTASGKCLAVTKQALEKAEKLLSKSTIEDINDATCSTNFISSSNCSCCLYKHNLSNVKSLLGNDTKDVEKSEETSIIERQINPHKCVQREKFKCQVTIDHVRKEELLKSNALFNEEASKLSKSNFTLTKSLKKRKIRDLDNDDMPMNKPKSGHFKKLRFSNETQAEKAISNSSMNLEEKENQGMTSVSAEVLILNCDVNKSLDNAQGNGTREKCNGVDNYTMNSLISNEIVASTVALLTDETDTFDQLVSSVESKQNEENPRVPSSPVIGGKFIPRKRKGVDTKRKSIGTLRSTEIKPISVNNIEQSDNDVNSVQLVNKECLRGKKQESKNKGNSILVVNEFDDTQLMIEFINHTENIFEKRVRAALEQDKQITLKKNCKPKPMLGVLYSYKEINRNNRISWREISKGNKPVPCTSEELMERKLPVEILNVSAANALTFKFRCTDFYGQDVQNNIEGIKLEDGGSLILDENGYVGIREIKRAFLACPGVDPNLLSDGWVENHYKWIVWKLASVNRIKLGTVVLPRVLTPARLMMELKYRYDREIDRSERSALRKIVEKDDVASKRMVLCVASIIKNDNCTRTAGSSSKKDSNLKISQTLMLTDGWYSIRAFVDQAMIKNITVGKVKEGTKLLTYGSELLNCDQGYPPLELPTNVSLKIHTNSTRRARWDARLGYVAPSGPFYIKLGTINSSGGLIGKIKVLITRVYPVLYREKISTGESIYRNARSEEKANIAYERECRLIIEAFCAKAEKRFSLRERRRCTDSTDLGLTEWNDDCEELSKEELLSTKIKEYELFEHNCLMREEKMRQKLESQLKEILPKPRQVTPLLKIRIIEEESNAVLSVWSPSEENVDILKEGNYVSICNVMPLGKRNNELQLSASRNTIFNQLNLTNITYPLRTYTSLCDINKSTFTPVYGEFDTVGIVVATGNEPYGMKNFEAVYLAYPDTSVHSSYISILFWHGIASYGYTEILTVGSFVACSNLEWRRATSWNIPMAYCTERSAFARNPRQNHLQQPFEDLKRSLKDTGIYITTCATEVLKEVQRKSMTRVSNFNTPNKNDFDHFDQISSNEHLNSPQERNPRNSTLNKKRVLSVQQRLEKLQCGEAPRLSPIVLNNSSKRVFSEFQSPVRLTNRDQTKDRTVFNNRLVKN